MSDLEARKGTYVLMLESKEETHHASVGPHGDITLPAGFYAYVGSAHGSGGVKARVGHHLGRHDHHPIWHLDYVRPALEVVEAWVTYDPIKRECAWSDLVRAALGGLPLV